MADALASIVLLAGAVGMVVSIGMLMVAGARHAADPAPYNKKARAAATARVSATTAV